MICEKLLKEHGPDAATYCLLGVVRDAQGRREDALNLLRRVLYLQPSHRQALVHMALLSESKGDLTAATNYRRRAERSGGQGEP